MCDRCDEDKPLEYLLFKSARKETTVMLCAECMAEARRVFEELLPRFKRKEEVKE